MEEYTCMIPRDTHDGAFYRAVLALHQDHYSLAQQCIDKARDILDTELTAMAGESYSRAYGAMVACQMLSELEEVIQYKLIPDRREVIRKTWWDRLQGCQRIVEDWQKVLMVRSLVLSINQNMRTLLKYASLCGKSRRLALAHKTLVTLLNVDPSTHLDQQLPTSHPRVTYAYMKYMWKSNQKLEAFQHMQHFVQMLQQQQQQQGQQGQQALGLAAASSPTDTDGHPQLSLSKLLARCYLKLGEWQLSLQGINESTIPQVLQYYSHSTALDHTWYKPARRANPRPAAIVAPMTKSSPPQQQQQQLSSAPTVRPDDGDDGGAADDDDDDVGVVAAGDGGDEATGWEEEP
ncbi:unnamed protein product [Lampetra planeri]